MRTAPRARGRALRQRDDTDTARLRGTADVVAERDGGVLHLALLGLALQLLVVLVDHAHAGGTRRVAERLETPVGVDRQLAAELERAGGDVLLRGTLLAEPEVLVGEQLGQREAVVHLRDLDLLPRIRNAGLGIDLLRRHFGRLPAQEVEARILLR